MTKADVVTEISYKTGSSKLEITQTVNTLLDTIKNSVADGRIISYVDSAIFKLSIVQNAMPETSEKTPLSS